MKHVLFLNENTLGHTSYLPLFASEMDRHPEWGVTPALLNVAPLPDQLERAAGDSFRGAGRVGLSRHYSRWRQIASRHAIEVLTGHRRKHPRMDALVVNTQSVGLDLPNYLDDSTPLYVCLDATFEQLRKTPWFAPNKASELLQPFTIGTLLQRERELFSRAQMLLPWSQSVADSLMRDYGIPAARITLLPPSLPVMPPLPVRAESSSVPRILFLGGDFRRKGGELLVECFCRYFSERAQLDIVTQTSDPSGPGIRVWKNIRAHSPEWLERWSQADLFVFPSQLETFGIVLLEAHAFGVPVVASRAGAAVELLEKGKAGWLIERLELSSLRDAIQSALDNPDARRAKTERGKALVESQYSLTKNSELLARRLTSFVSQSETKSL